MVVTLTRISTNDKFFSGVFQNGHSMPRKEIVNEQATSMPLVVTVFRHQAMNPV